MKHGYLLFCIFLLIILQGCKETSKKKTTTVNETTTIREETTTTTQNVTTTTEPQISFNFLSLDLLTEDVKMYGKAEWKLNMDGFSGNPFNPEEIDLVGEFTSPSGKRYTMPLFWYQEYHRRFIELGDPLQNIAQDWTENTAHYGFVEVIEKADTYVLHARFNSPNGEFQKIGRSVTYTSDDAQNYTHVKIISSGSGYDETVRFEFYTPSGAHYVLVDLNHNQLNEQILELQGDITNSTWMQFYPSGPMTHDFYIQKVELYNPSTLESKVVFDINREAKELNPNDPYGREAIDKVGDAHFRLRFSPVETGNWDLKLKLKTGHQYTEVLNQNFHVLENDENKGFIYVEETQKRSFVFSDGSSYIPIGQNVSWWSSGDRRSYDYDMWYTNMAQYGANFSRVWLCDWGYGLFWKDTGIENYTKRLNNAYRLDKQLEIAEDLGIYIDLVLFHHGQFSTRVNPEWSNNPYNEVNGGPLKYANEFFTNDEAMKATKQYLRYIIARYGYSTNIFTWELFNEVNFTDSYNMTNVSNWHRIMSIYMKDIDPYNHLITTSTESLYDPTYGLDSIDFVSKHLYTHNSLTNEISSLTTKFLELYDKPFLLGEVGLDVNGNQNELDPTGIHMHQALWSGLMSGGAGAGQLWWWDTYVHPQDLYHHFGPISTYAASIDLGKAQLSYVIDESQITIENDLIEYKGYANLNTYYLWLYEKDFDYKQTEISDYKDETIRLVLEDGTYQVKWFDTYSGTFIQSSSETVELGALILTIPDFQKDIALIIEK